MPRNPSGAVLPGAAIILTAFGDGIDFAALGFIRVAIVFARADCDRGCGHVRAPHQVTAGPASRCPGTATVAGQADPNGREMMALVRLLDSWG